MHVSKNRNITKFILNTQMILFVEEWADFKCDACEGRSDTEEVVNWQQRRPQKVLSLLHVPAVQADTLHITA